MLSRLGAAQERQRGLVSDTAHELRSPIASIRAQLEVALDHPDSQDWRQTAADVLADTLRLARLAEDLLVAGPAGRAGPAPADRASWTWPRWPPDEVARYTDARVPVLLTEGQPGPVTGDPDGLRRMLSNLIDNAVRYARSRVGRDRGAWTGGMSGSWWPTTAPASPERTGSGSSAGSPGWTTTAAGTATTAAGPGWAWPSSGPPPRRTAARPGWRTPSQGCARSCCCPAGYQPPHGSTAVTAMTANSSVR